MPELPEVETVRRTMRRALQGKKIVEAEIPPDEIVLSGLPPDFIAGVLKGATVTDIGRKGKYWWIELDRQPWLMGHLGMAGWIRELGAPTIRLREHGQAPMDDQDGRPRFLKMLLTAEDGSRIAFTDGRRLGRLWVGNPAEDQRILDLGPDTHDAPWSTKDLHAILSKRRAPIKALLLDQALFAGVGNWIADEVLYHAKISPKREASSLSAKDVEKLLKALKMVLEKAVEVGADSEKYPPGWLFMHRWGGKKGTDMIEGKQIIREKVGSRTTAWVPEVQK